MPKNNACALEGVFWSLYYISVVVVGGQCALMQCHASHFLVVHYLHDGRLLVTLL